MKKLLLLAVVAIAAISCEKEHKGDELYMRSREFEVQNQHWNFEVDEVNERRFSYTFDMPELTRKVCEIGEVSATCYLDGKKQSQLPEAMSSENGEYYQVIRYEYEPGKITFVVTYTTMQGTRYWEEIEPGHLWFRVVLSY